MKDSGITIGWATTAARIVELGAFFASTVVKLPEYISHGEIQTELSRDGARWDADAAKLIAGHFQQLSREKLPQKVAGAWTESNKPVAVAIVELVERDKLTYAVLADILVDKDARLRGTGQRMMRFIEKELRAWRVDWLFLESGLRNESAHRFFERLDYHEISRIFAKRLLRRRRT